jgi:hypothetical protein
MFQAQRLVVVDVIVIVVRLLGLGGGRESCVLVENKIVAVTG